MASIIATHPHRPVENLIARKVQEVEDKYGLSVGVQVVHAIYPSFGRGIIDGFEANSGQVLIKVKWEHINSSVAHGPGILAKIGGEKNDRSGPNQGFKVHKCLLNKDKK